MATDWHWHWPDGRPTFVLHCLHESAVDLPFPREQKAPPDAQTLKIEKMAVFACPAYSLAAAITGDCPGVSCRSLYPC